jgi:hypothetical protein
MKVLTILVLLFAGLSASFAADAKEKHASIKITEDFYSAVASGEFDKALALTNGRYPKEKLQKMKDALRVEDAEVQEAHVGKENVAIVTHEIAPRDEKQARKGRWGVSLRLIDGKWLIRDFDFLPNDEAVQKWLGEFQKVEPKAEKVVVSE